MANKFGQKETPAPVNREGLRKKCPGSTQKSHTRLAEDASFPLPLALNFAI